MGDPLSLRLSRRVECVVRGAWRNFGIDSLTGRHIYLREDLLRLGSDYGGWIIPATLIERGSVCYCAGAGEDITFDLALVERFGCDVHIFDPTPRAIAHVKRVAAAVPQIHLHPVGLWDREETLKFYAPANPAHVSHSVLNLQHTDAYFEARCCSLPDLMRSNGHDHLDLLKIDIEGAEYRVLQSLLANRIYVRVLCVEYDEAVHPVTRASRARIVESVASLLDHGYQLVAQEGRSNYSFVTH
ncbi:MAG TPA: FkbM family methyltransferase [Steroidobacteraceae bacterium]